MPVEREGEIPKRPRPMPLIWKIIFTMGAVITYYQFVGVL